MQVVGNAPIRSENFNGVSEKLKDELIRPLKPGEVVHFQLLQGSYDVILKRDVFGSSRSIRLRDRIYDPYAQEITGKDGKPTYKGAYVEIGVPETIVNGRVERCKKYWVESVAVGIPGNGQFDLYADKLEDVEIYEILCLKNGNKDNPYRSKTNEPEYEIIYPEKAVAAQSEKDFKELRAKLTRYAKNNPEQAKELIALIPKEKQDEVTV